MEIGEEPLRVAPRSWGEEKRLDFIGHWLTEGDGAYPRGVRLSREVSDANKRGAAKRGAGGS